MIIEAENIKKQYENEEVVTKILHGLSLTVSAGEFVAIMGPSGSGKSTLMHILGLLDRPTSGQLKIFNKNIEDFDDEDLAHLRNQKIGFIFQAFNLLARTTVLENVALPLIYSDNRKNINARAKKVLSKVGLEHRLDYFSNQISGGEKQRVAIARALVNNPDLIFADEPTGNLDSKSGLQVMSMLQELNEQGKTVILVTHETYTAEHAKRIIKMKDGLIVDDSLIKQRRLAGQENFLK